MEELFHENIWYILANENSNKHNSSLSELNYKKKFSSRHLFNAKTPFEYLEGDLP